MVMFDCATLRRSPDVRALTWREWTSWVNYTYVMYAGTPAEVLSRCSSSIRRTVVKTLDAGLHVESSEDLGDFLSLYEKTFQKQDMSVPLPPGAVEELFRVATERESARHYVARDRDGAVVSGLIQLRCGFHANTWLLASAPERLRDGVATCTQLHSFSTNVEGVEYVDDASANVENFHHNAVRSGGKLLTVLGTYYCNSSVLRLKNTMGSISRDVSRSINIRWRQ